MTKFLTTKGTPFRTKEVEGQFLFPGLSYHDLFLVTVLGFMSVAKDLDTGRIYYEDYIALLTADAESFEQ